MTHSVAVFITFITVNICYGEELFYYPMTNTQQQDEWSEISGTWDFWNPNEQNCPNDSVRCWRSSADSGRARLELTQPRSTLNYQNIVFSYQINVGVEGDCSIRYQDGNKWVSIVDIVTSGESGTYSAWDLNDNSFGVKIAVVNKQGDCYINEFKLVGDRITPSPTLPPTNDPTLGPTLRPQPTPQPTPKPITITTYPTSQPTEAPQAAVTTNIPNKKPTEPPISKKPTLMPSVDPTVTPITSKPTTQPPITAKPTESPITPKPTLDLPVFEPTNADIGVSSEEETVTVDGGQNEKEQSNNDLANIGSFSIISTNGILFILAMVLLLCLCLVAALFCAVKRNDKLKRDAQQLTKVVGGGQQRIVCAPDSPKVTSTEMVSSEYGSNPNATNKANDNVLVEGNETMNEREIVDDYKEDVMDDDGTDEDVLHTDMMNENVMQQEEDDSDDDVLLEGNMTIGAPHVPPVSQEDNDEFSESHDDDDLVIAEMNTIQ